jgi:hypothetical protein
VREQPETGRVEEGPGGRRAGAAVQGGPHPAWGGASRRALLTGAGRDDGEDALG